MLKMTRGLKGKRGGEGNGRVSSGRSLSVVYWNSNIPQNGKSVKERVISGERVLENGDLGVDLPF